MILMICMGLQGFQGFQDLNGYDKFDRTFVCRRRIENVKMETSKERKIMNRRLLFISLAGILAVVPVWAQQAAKKTVTNADLEKYRQTRQKAEADYRENYKKLGMPSPEELQRLEAERQQLLAEYAARKRAEDAESAENFQAQADQLRSQLINVQGQIDYVNRQIGNTPQQNPIFISPSQLSGVTIVSGYGYGGRRQPRGGGNFNRGRVGNTVTTTPNVQAAINNAASAPNPYAGTALERTGVKAVIGENNLRRRGRFNRPFYGGFGIPYVYYNNPSDRDQLISNLRYLEQVRAGLLAQFQAVQEAARRAGVKID